MAIGYASVKVNITSFVVDGIDSDDLPDDAPLTAKLMLSPMIQPGRTLQYNGAGQMKLKAVAPIVVDIGATGDISHQGRDFVKVVAPTAVETNLARLQWRADFSDIRLGGALAAVKIDPIYFWVDPGAEINIADHVNVAASTAVSISRGARGFGIVGFETVDGDLVPLYESADGVIAGEPIPLSAVVSDASVSSLVTDDGSATRAALAGVVAPKLDKSEAAQTYVKGSVSETEPTSPTVGMVWFGPYTDPNPKPSTPGNVTLVAGSGVVDISWDASTDDGAIYGYRIYRNGALIASPLASPYSDTGVDNGTGYSYRVAAVDDLGQESDRSAAQTATPQVTLATIPDLAAHWDANTLGAAGSSVTSFVPNAGTWTAPLTAPAAAPTVKADAVNGRKAIQFVAASSQYLDLDNPDVAGPTTMFIVFKLMSEGTGRVLTGKTLTNYRGLRPSTTVGTINMNSPGGHTFYAPWTPASGWCVAALLHAGTTGNSAFYFNKLSAETGNNGNQSDNPFTDLRIARSAGTSGAEYANLELADLVIVTRACSDSEIKAVMSELAAKYALTLGA